MISCFTKLLKDGDISQATFDTLADAQSKSKTFDDMNAKIDENINSISTNYKNRALNHKKIVDLQDYAKNAPDSGEAISDLITKRKGGPASVSNIEYTIKEYAGRAMIPLSKYMDDLRSKFGGLKINTKLLDNISMRIFDTTAQVDKQVSGIVKAMEDSLKLTNERLMANGITPVIDNLSQLGALSNKISNISADQFFDFARPLLQNSDDEIRAAYKAAQEGEEVMAFKFNNGAAETEYRKRIGGDSFSNLINYIDRASAKAAAANVLGMNPAQTIKNLAKDANLKEAETARLINMYQHATGTATQKANPNKVALSLSAARAIGTASMMGSSPITALLDVATMGLTAIFNGLPQMKLFSKMVKNLASKKSRMELNQLGFQLESVMSALSNTSRFNPHSTTSDTLNKVSTGVLRVSGLLAMSDASKLAVKNTFLVNFRDYKTLSFASLQKKNKSFHKQLEAYNIKGKEWDEIRNAINDSDMILDPSKLNDNVSHLVYRFINEEADYAVVTPGARSAYWTSLGQDKGTVLGETVKSMTQFKSTIVEQVMTHLYRTARVSGMENKLAYGAQYFIATTILGGMVYQIKQAANNKTPVDPTKDPLKFLGESITQGGAVPILSDMVGQYMDPKWYDASPIEMLLKPASINTPLKIIEKGIKSVIHEGTGDTKDARKAEAGLAKDMMSLMPGQNIWYFKMFFNEYAKEFTSQLIDPKSAKKRQRRINKDMKKNNQKNIFDL